MARVSEAVADMDSEVEVVLGSEVEVVLGSEVAMVSVVAEVEIAIR